MTKEEAARWFCFVMVIFWIISSAVAHETGGNAKPFLITAAVFCLGYLFIPNDERMDK